MSGIPSPGRLHVRFLLALALVALLFACVPRAEPRQEVCASEADFAAWLETGELPAEVAGYTDCDFNKFAWQSFIDLMRPDESGARTYESWISRWELLEGRTAYANTSQVPAATLVDYVEAGPTPNPLVDQNGEWTYYDQRINASAEYFLRACGLIEPDCLRAITEPFPPVNPQPAHPVRYPDGSAELKEAWKVMGPGDNPQIFVTREATVVPAKAGTVAQAEVSLGLTGLHVVRLTPDHGAWVWATFEHRANAPDCDELAERAASDERYNYFDPSCAERCRERQQDGEITAGVSCAEICGELNVYHNNDCPLDTQHSQGVSDPPATTLRTFPCGSDLEGTCYTSSGCFEGIVEPPGKPDYYANYYGGDNCFRADASLTGSRVASMRRGVEGCSSSIPTQVCRAWPVGFRGVSLGPDGEVIPEIDTTLTPLNDALAAWLRDSGIEWAEVLANYRLVGVQWGDPKPGVEDPIWSQEIQIAGDPMLLNVTLEAYIQGGGAKSDRDEAISDFSTKGAARGGCLDCHGAGAPQFSWNSFQGVNFRPWRQQHFSHGLDYLAAPTGSGDESVCVEAVRTARAAAGGDPWKKAILDHCPIAATG